MHPPYPPPTTRAPPKQPGPTLRPMSYSHTGWQQERWGKLSCGYPQIPGTQGVPHSLGKPLGLRILTHTLGPYPTPLGPTQAQLRAQVTNLEPGLCPHFPPPWGLHLPPGSPAGSGALNSFPWPQCLQKQILSLSARIFPEEEGFFLAKRKAKPIHIIKCWGRGMDEWGGKKNVGAGCGRRGVFPLGWKGAMPEQF